MMTRPEKVLQLRRRIEAGLGGLIDRDYVLLDLPYYMNIGDILIWEGERQYLDTLCLKHLNAGYRYRETSRIRDDTLILLQGGGNFGDLYRVIQDERLRVIQRYKDNPILIFPVTFHYESIDIMRRDADIMAAHPHLTICARDLRSHRMLQENFGNRTVLLPDMAFFIQPHSLRSPPPRNRSGLLYIQRTDRELAPDEAVLEAMRGDAAMVSDWPVLVSEPRHWLVYKRLKEWGLQWNREARCLRGLWRAGDVVSKLSDLFYHEVSRRLLIRRGVSFIGAYSHVCTNRLHGAILAMLMDRSVAIVDNSYGKNADYYRTWLADVEGVRLLNE